MARLRTIVGLLGAGFGAAAGLGAAGYWAALRRPLPQTSGRLLLPGLHAPVEVVRDTWGVPHITAQTAADLFMTQGFVHAQDRLWQMEFQRRLGHGRLAEIFGAVALDTDRFARTLSLTQAARADEAALTGEARAALTAYAAGINAYLAQNARRLPFEFTVLRLRPDPWQPTDTLVWAKIMALGLSENWVSELLHARIVALLGPERASQLIPRYAPDAPLTIPAARYAPGLGTGALNGAAALNGVLGRATGQGSNAWVVDRLHSSTGRPLLADDPHLAISMPSIWYENHLTGGGYAVTGASFPGCPGVVIGHNARIAWGVTNVMADVQDLYIERFDPADPTRYQTESGWQQAEVRLETIAVKGQRQPHIERVLVTRHGPVIDLPAAGQGGSAAVRLGGMRGSDAQEQGGNGAFAGLDASGAPLPPSEASAPERAAASGAPVPASEASAPVALALRWTAYTPSGLVGALLDLNRATDWPSFRAALAGWTCPPQNFVYADVDGHIGYSTGGAIPLRRGWDGALPVPGWDGAHEWDGYIPNAELPHVLDPAEGLLVTANNRIVDDHYPHPFHAAWLNGYRAARIGALLREAPQHSPQSFAQIHADVLSLPGLALARLAARLPAETPVAAAARAALSGWDGILSAASVGGMVYARLREHLLAEVYAEIAGLNDPLGLGAFASLPLEGFLVRAFPEVLRRCEARDDAWLGAGRSWDGVLTAAWGAALTDMRAELGEDVAEWRYGRWHTLTIGHPLGAVPALARLLNRGPLPLGGDVDTVCMGNKPRKTAGPPSYTAPSYRQILDVGAWDACQSIHPTGQSGHPASPHYADFVAEWRAVRYHPMPWSRAAVLEHAAATLNLVPDP